MERFSIGQRVAGALVLVVVVVVLIACGGSTDTNTGTVVTATVTAPAQAKHYQVGDQVKTGTWVVTINSVKTSKGDGQFNVPKNGEFVIVDISFKNLDTKSDTLSSILQYTFKDESGQEYDNTFVSLPGADHSAEGDVAAGDLLRGQLVYDVAATLHKFTFTFKADAFSTGGVTWDITV